MTSFVQLVWANNFASFHNFGTDYAALRSVDSCFLSFLDGIVDPEDLAAIPLVYRAHSAFRAAVQLAMGGQVPECHMVLRGAIENALYANHINLHPGAYSI